MFSAMSYGSISYNAFRSLVEAAKEVVFCNCGEGGLHPGFILGRPTSSFRQLQAGWVVLIIWIAQQ